MEGPSLYLAAELLQPLVGKKIQGISGNTKIEKERLAGKKVLAIFSFGKTLIFQFDVFALRVHFLLFGSFEAVIKGKKVTGDYPKKARTPRLALKFSIGEVFLYACSLRFLEDSQVFSHCDFSMDTISMDWDPKKALRKLQEHPEKEIGDLLLDQTIFLGVGNIIRNEVLFLRGLSPLKLVGELSPMQSKKLIATVKKYVHQFYEWRKAFVLRKHYQIYRQHTCKQCGGPVTRQKTGVLQRMSYFCPACQNN